MDIGIKGIKQTIVTEEVTAKSMLSGQLPVYATPSLIAFVEFTCAESVQKYLDDGLGTVGTLINIKHIAASPVGATIRCESELTQIDRKRLVFSVNVYDNFELIAQGTHERFIITNSKFMAKSNDKLSKLHLM